MEQPYIVSAFYKYVTLEDVKAFREALLSECNEIGLRGRILVAAEGINGSVSGTVEQIETFKSYLRADERFSDIEYKDEGCLMHPFKKMMVKIKNEIVRFEQNVDLRNTGTFLSPSEFYELTQTNKDVVLIDARNDYEANVGKFKGAVTLPIKTFREFPAMVKELEQYKDKKVVTYCTGGIRCEKASAYLVEQGFKDVSQIKGGILAFGKQFPDTIWEGKCFVFDKRLLSSVNHEESPLTNCEICNVSCDLYKNCAQVLCDKYCTVCLDCEQQYGGCCSKVCFNSMQQNARQAAVA